MQAAAMEWDMLAQLSQLMYSLAQTYMQQAQQAFRVRLQYNATAQPHPVALVQCVDRGELPD